MKTLTTKQYQLHIQCRSLGAEIAALEREKKQAKAELLKLFGRAKNVKTPIGTTLSITIREIVPTEIPKPYSYSVITEK